MLVIKFTSFIKVIVVMVALLSLVADGHNICNLEYCTCNNSNQKINCTCSNNNEPLKGYISVTNTSLPSSLQYLYINRCKNVKITSQSFSSLQNILSVSLENIETLITEVRAFQRSRVFPIRCHTDGYHDGYYTEKHVHRIKIYINNIINWPTIESFTFNGYMDAIEISNSSIKNISPYAISDICLIIDKIIFDNVKIELIDKFAIRSIVIRNLSFRDCHIKYIRSLSIFKSMVKDEFNIINTNIDEFSSTGFDIIGPSQSLIQNSRINNMKGGCLNISTRGNIKLNHNIFVHMDTFALRGLRPLKVQDLLRLFNTQDGYSEFPNKPDFKFESKLIFENNSISSLDSGSLYIDSGYQININKIILINTTCYCNMETLVIDMMGLEKSINADDYTTTPNQDTKQLYDALWCKSSKNMQYIPVSNYQKEVCSTLNSQLIIYIVIAIVILIIIILIALIVVFVFVKKKRKFEMVLPENVKTYKETEFQFIPEELEPLEITNVTQEQCTANENTTQQKHVTFVEICNL